MVSSIVSFFDLFEFGFDCTDNYNGITDDIVFAPNPNNGNFSIFNNSDQQIESGIAIVTNSLGQKVYENTLFSLSPGDKHYFSLGELSQGVYVLVLEYQDKFMSRKFIVN